MAFTATPLDGSTTPIPMPTVVPDATNTPIVTEGGPSKVTGGNTLAPVAVYQYDGYNVTQGITTDTAVTGDTSGTISAKLRGLSKIWNDMWDSTNHWLQVKVMNGNANGQATMVNSSPVVLASDELVPIGLNAGPPFQQWNSVDFAGDSGHTGIGTMGNYLFDGNSGLWARQRQNQDGIALVASGAYTTTQTSADQINFNHRGCIIVLDVTVPGTGSITLEIDGKDPVSGKYYVMLAGAIVTTLTTVVYRVYPGLAAVANSVASDILPKTWRVKVTANNANSMTYSVGAITIY